MLTSLEAHDGRSEELISLRRLLGNAARVRNAEIATKRKSLSEARALPLSKLPARGEPAYNLPEFDKFFDAAYNAGFSGVFSHYIGYMESLLEALQNRAVYFTYKLGDEVEYVKGNRNRNVTNVFMTAQFVEVSQETGVKSGLCVRQKILHSQTPEERASEYYDFVWNKLKKNGVPAGLRLNYGFREWLAAKGPRLGPQYYKSECSLEYEFFRRSEAYAKVLQRSGVLEPELMTNFGPKTPATIASANAVRGATLHIKAVPNRKDATVYLLSALRYTPRKKFTQDKVLILEKNVHSADWKSIARTYDLRPSRKSHISVVPFFWYPPRERYLIEGII